MKSKPSLFRSLSKFTLAPSCAVISICFGGLASAAVWDGTGTVTTDWNDNGNWVGDAGTVGSAATININSPVATISANPPGNPADVLIGSGTGTNGRLDHNAGTLATGSWMKIGHNGGTGVYNLTAAGAGGTYTGLAQGSGSLNLNGGQLRLGGDNATITTGNGTMNVHTTGTVTTTAEIVVGGNGAGTLNMDSGTINHNSGGNFIVGRGAGITGLMRISGGALNNNSGEFQVGKGSGNGTVTLSGSGSITTGSWVGIGHSGGNGTLNIDGGTLTKTGNGSDFIVADGSTGTLNQTAGAMTVAGDATHGLVVGLNTSTANYNLSGGTLGLISRLVIAKNANSNGTLTLSGTGAINTIGPVSVGRTGGIGVMTVNGGTLTNSGTEELAIGEASTGTLNQTNGTISAGGQFWVGSSTGTGSYTMSGGTLNVGSWFVVGRNAGGVGTLTMSNGTINKTGGGDLVVGADNATATGTISASGGLINVTGGVTHIGKGGGTGTLTISGTADFRTTQMVVGEGTGIGTLNLNGGILKTPKLNGGPGSATAYFNGGTLQATMDSVTFISNLDTAEILAGGAVLDTQAFTETASQVFTGTGTLTKLGSGTLTLTGDSTHTGLTQVSDGKLVVSTRSIPTAGDFAVANGTTFGVTRRLPEETLNASNVTLGTTASTTTLEINLGNFGNPALGVGTLNVLGTLAVNANTTVNITHGFPAVGSFPLIQFGSRTGSGTITLGSLPPGMVAYLDDTISPNAIYLVITQARLLEWDDSELAGGVWDTTNTNWNELFTGVPVAFTTGDPVNFMDFGNVDNVNPPNPNVVIDAAGVSPGSVTFNNSVLAYTVTGAGGINGTSGLLKQGTGSVTISTANAYTGVTRLEAGTLSVSSIANAGGPSGIGAAPAAAANLVFAGGKLSYTGSGDTTDRGFSIAAANSVFDVQGTLTMSGPVAASAGQFTKTGAGTLTLSNPGANVLANGGGPGFTVNEGSLVLNGGGTQTNSVVNDIYLGMSTATSADLVLTDTTLTSTGLIAIARGFLTPGSSSSCTLNNSTVTMGNISLGWDDNVVGYSATSILTLNNSTLNAAYNKIAEKGGATSTVVLNGSSTMTATSTDVGQNTGAIGTLNVKGTSIYTSSNRLVVGLNAGTSGTVVVENSGNIVTPNFVSVGFGGGGALTVKDTGTLSVGNDFSVGEGGDVPASVTLQDSGTITVGTVTYVGRNATRAGTITVTGGTYTGNGGEFRIGNSGTGTWLQSGGITNAGGWVSIGRETGGTGVLTVSGTTTFNQTGTGNALIVGEHGNGALNIQGSATVSSVGTGGVVITRAGGTGVINLDGGTLVAVKVVEDGGTSTFNFNGGVLKAGTGAAPVFMTGIDTAMVKVGGATIDSNGSNIALNQNFTNDTSSGNFTKTGAGTLFVNGNIGILGQAHVSAGTISGTGHFICALFVDGSSNLNPGGATPGILTANSTTFAATSTMTIDLAATQDSLLTGALVLNGATLALNGTATQPVYVIAEYSSLAAGATGKFAGGMSPPALPAGYTIDYAYNGGTQIALIQTATPYTAWAATNITAIDPLADATPNSNPDNDGLTNLAEFGLNGNPMSGGSSGKVVSQVANVGGVPSLVLTLPVRTVATFTSGANNEQNSNLVSGLLYTIEGSNALAAWNIPVSEVTGGDKTAIELPLVTGNPADSGWSYRTFTTGPISGSSKEFLRAVIKQP
ncbi:MAG: autotransporter-associated beta strand repeat-containing protein [Verrucomicrobiota bacterium]